MKYLFYTLFIILVSCSKKESSIECIVFNDIQDNQKDSIDLKDYTKFSWDSVYIFQVPVSYENINKIIGVKYTNYEEFTRPIIFFKNNKIVYSENEESSMEGIKEGQLVYKGLNNTDKYIFRTRTNTKFKVSITKENNKKYIVLD